MFSFPLLMTFDCKKPATLKEVDYPYWWYNVYQTVALSRKLKIQPAQEFSKLILADSSKQYGGSLDPKQMAFAVRVNPVVHHSRTL